ncbi:hypothetical protein EO98_04500 [Methanosarcina sp. 2.H.T.1A.6]|uniref:hypothetical protein n=1 Tax=unclassified Methanosarcina TaxID=2644672 RepID=UPI0006227691|nr:MULTISPECIES: hypothetical protein [unclassified Methanosarcina]KKG15607.1 hypothetical protein EO94_14775 [Methanosarcina sp. 2.H.T.1A.3]KKG19531.1 hypothetical protein EO98_04500 [Methanosarcina sp. 2.H.T.1A.6]KKG27508.1 hypothetical protein EO96_11520 [Methanosarcina sp. 2.H.T.1A.8]KKG28441.1 hypothetical protein EO97_00015 [Methanosarcina sp. 2.H.T.1A.15]
MDLKTIYETNFTIFIGIFVTLVVMGTTTLYDKYKSKGGSSFDLEEFKFFSNLNQKITTFSSEGLKHFSEYCKKISSFIPKRSGSSLKMSSSAQKKSRLIHGNSSKKYLEKVETIFFKAKDTGQKLFVNFKNKISSISSTLPRRNKQDEGKFVSLSSKMETDSQFNAKDRVNNLEKVVESKKDELDFDDDLLTKMSTTDTLKSNIPEANTADPFFSDMASELGESLDNDLMFDGNEFDIKIDGLDNESDEDNFSFDDNSTEIKFGDESDSLLDSLKKEIVISKEKKVNFMGDMQGEDLDLKLMKSDLEGILRDLKKQGRYSKS